MRKNLLNRLGKEVDIMDENKNIQEFEEEVDKELSINYLCIVLEETT